MTLNLLQILMAYWMETKQATFQLRPAVLISFRWYAYAKDFTIELDMCSKPV
jgi:hypothetical protein